MKPGIISVLQRIEELVQHQTLSRVDVELGPDRHQVLVVVVFFLVNFEME